MVGGKGTFRFGDEPASVTGGQIVVYTPGQPQIYSYYAKDSTEAYWIHFTGYEAGHCLEQFGLLHPAVHTVGEMDETAALFKKIIHELNMNKPYCDDITAAYLLTMLTLLGRRLQYMEEQRKADPHEDIHKIMELMHESYSQNLVVADLAKACSLSLFRFIHKFKAATGTTPLQYLTSIRMNEAKKLLSETSMPVREIASIVGYENPLYFSRVFSQAVGVPPSRYKELL